MPARAFRKIRVYSAESAGQSPRASVPTSLAWIKRGCRCFRTRFLVSSTVDVSHSQGRSVSAAEATLLWSQPRNSSACCSSVRLPPGTGLAKALPTGRRPRAVAYGDVANALTCRRVQAVIANQLCVDAVPFRHLLARRGWTHRQARPKHFVLGRGLALRRAGSGAPVLPGEQEGQHTITGISPGVCECELRWAAGGSPRSRRARRPTPDPATGVAALMPVARPGPAWLPATTTAAAVIAAESCQTLRSAALPDFVSFRPHGFPRQSEPPSCSHANCAPPSCPQPTARLELIPGPRVCGPRNTAPGAAGPLTAWTCSCSHFVPVHGLLFHTPLAHELSSSRPWPRPGAATVRPERRSHRSGRRLSPGRLRALHRARPPESPTRSSPAEWSPKSAARPWSSPASPPRRRQPRLHLATGPTRPGVAPSASESTSLGPRSAWVGH